MKRVAAFLCLAAVAGAWSWALFAPREERIEPLRAGFAGRYAIAGFEPPRGSGMQSPLPLGDEYLLTFGEDGTYVLSVRVGGYEMERRQGIVAVDASGVLVLTQVSRNLREDPAPPERFHAEWAKDKDGPFLALRHIEQGYAYRLQASPMGAEPPR